MVVGVGKTVFLPFFAFFLPCFFYIFSIFIHIIRIFWKEIGPSLLFLTLGTTNTKVRRSTGVATANSTNKYPNANQLSWAINYLAPHSAMTKPAAKVTSRRNTVETCELCASLSWVEWEHISKGSPSFPISMNFRKISERPLTPPAPFSEKNIAIFSADWLHPH